MHIFQLKTKGGSVGSDRLNDLMTELRIQDFTVERTIKGVELDGKRYHPSTIINDTWT